MKLINWDIASHPLNWITLFLMAYIFAIVAHFVLTHVTVGRSINAAGAASAVTS